MNRNIPITTEVTWYDFFSYMHISQMTVTVISQMRSNKVSVND